MHVVHRQGLQKTKIPARGLKSSVLLYTESCEDSASKNQNPREGIEIGLYALIYPVAGLLASKNQNPREGIEISQCKNPPRGGFLLHLQKTKILARGLKCARWRELRHRESTPAASKNQNPREGIEIQRSHRSLPRAPYPSLQKTKIPARGLK